MNFYEAEIVKCQKRIKKIEENPDPVKFKSNKILYEIERDLNIARLRDWREGKPFIEGLTAPLMSAMGCQPMAIEFCADRSTLDRSRLDTIRALGLPDYACDRTVVCIDMCMKKELPPPNLIVSHNCASLMAFLWPPHPCLPMLSASRSFSSIPASIVPPVRHQSDIFCCAPCPPRRC